MIPDRIQEMLRSDNQEMAQLGVNFCQRNLGMKMEKLWEYMNFKFSLTEDEEGDIIVVEYEMWGSSTTSSTTNYSGVSGTITNLWSTLQSTNMPLYNMSTSSSNTITVNTNGQFTFSLPSQGHATIGGSTINATGATNYTGTALSPPMATNSQSVSKPSIWSRIREAFRTKVSTV